ncbi:hypothetical protein [Limnohabitans planktonicus]|uniref:Uncharacterized protein n=1 Tax=Limnohabitans planktonicus II-D5 TaxID=1293045 RepID=A0A2T7U8H8_9BURK|nr:hypothetical protein [Limnohabitans planktonicus]PVE40986.1 hypothetical protein H663_019515 [Limnohabitans planktonicus II-D5]|eukprot:gene1837-1802_t
MKVFLDDERATPEGWVRLYWSYEAGVEEAVHLRGFVPPLMHVHSANSAARVRMLAGIEVIATKAA